MSRAPYPYPTHGWSAVALYRALTIKELQDLSQFVRDMPESQNPAHKSGGEIHLYTKPARKKLDALTWAISYHLQDRR